MKFIHLSDLHLGKRINEFSMINDQKYILKQIVSIVDAENPDGVFIAGDVYDKSVPPAEAVQLFDDFLFELSKRKTDIFVISGNHDSPERIAFGSRLMKPAGVYMSPVYDGKVSPVKLSDDFGVVNVYMLPFIKPAVVKRFFPDAEINSYTDAVREAVNRMNINIEDRNVIITHQFVTGSMRSDSEDISVGGADNVDSSVFADFDYTALGHIHGPQSVGSDYIRYCGTPLKYSFSEAKHVKSVTILELFEKSNTVVRTVPLVPMRDMREIKGSYMEISDRNYYSDMDRNDYLHITLTDDEDIPYVAGKLRAIYPNLMKLDYDNARTRSGEGLSVDDNATGRSPYELFSDFYKAQNNRNLSDEQDKYIKDLMEKVWGDEL